MVAAVYLEETTRTVFSLEQHLMLFLVPEWPNPLKKFLLGNWSFNFLLEKSHICLLWAARSVAVLYILKNLIPEAS